MGNLLKSLGKVALGSRIRLLGEAITKDAEQIYRLYGIEMNPKWFPVFYTLSKAEDKTITTIAKEIGHSHVSVSKIVVEMKTAKLIVEKKNDSDKRRTIVSLSKAGKKIVDQIQDQYIDVGEALDEISQQATHDLWKALEEWEYLLSEKSLLNRVGEKKKLREAKDVQIVSYQPKYKSAFRKLNEEWITTYFKLEKPDRDALGNPEKYILDRGGHIFVALLKGNPVGVCALLKRDDKLYPYELAKMAVSPEAQGKSIGLLLGKAIIAKAISMKAERLFLESNTVLKPAINLYQKLGFIKVVGPKTPYERANIQMELKLKP